MLILVIIAAIVFLLPSFLIFDARLRDVASQIESVRNEKEVVEAKDLEKEMETARTLLSLAGASSTSGVSGFLKIVLTHKISTVSYTSFVFSDELHTEIRGIARDRQALASFVRSLEKDTRIAHVESPLSNLIAERNIIFTILVEWKKEPQTP